MERAVLGRGVTRSLLDGHAQGLYSDSSPRGRTAVSPPEAQNCVCCTMSARATVCFLTILSVCLADNLTTSRCAGGKSGSYSALTRNLVSSASQVPTSNAPSSTLNQLSSNLSDFNGLHLPAGFYDGILAVAVAPAGMVKLFALFQSGVVLGMTEDVDMENSVGGMAFNVIPSRGINAVFVWTADGCRKFPYPRGMPAAGLCVGEGTLLDNREEGGEIAGELDYISWTHYYKNYARRGFSQPRDWPLPRAPPLYNPNSTPPNSPNPRRRPWAPL